jgi:hypothetical protein
MKNSTDLPLTLQEKVQRYHAFWINAPASRPLIGFSLGGWFPLQSYPEMAKFFGRKGIAANELHPEDFLADYDRLVAPWEEMEDDVIRAVAPLPPFPWLEAMLGANVQVGDEAIWALEGGFEYADLDALDLSSDNPWRRKYLEFVAALHDRFHGHCPVGQPILRGVSDMIASLRGACRMVFDLYDHPEQFQRLAERAHCGREVAQFQGALGLAHELLRALFVRLALHLAEALLARHVQPLNQLRQFRRGASGAARSSSPKKRSRCANSSRRRRGVGTFASSRSPRRTSRPWPTWALVSSHFDPLRILKGDRGRHGHRPRQPFQATSIR